MTFALAFNDKLTEHVIKVGLRWDFDKVSIFERDRLGMVSIPRALAAGRGRLADR